MRILLAFAFAEFTAWLSKPHGMRHEGRALNPNAARRCRKPMPRVASISSAATSVPQPTPSEMPDAGEDFRQSGRKHDVRVNGAGPAFSASVARARGGGRQDRSHRSSQAQTAFRPPPWQQVGDCVDSIYYLLYLINQLMMFNGCFGAIRSLYPRQESYP
jgi:hypothetical protein